MGNLGRSAGHDRRRCTDDGCFSVLPDSSLVGCDAGEIAGVGRNGVVCVSDLAQVVNDFEVLIDFTSRKAPWTTWLCVSKHGKAIVVGTTGLNDDQLARVRAAAEHSPVFFTPNMSVGVNVLLTCCLRRPKFSVMITMSKSLRHTIDLRRTRLPEQRCGWGRLSQKRWGAI